MDIQNLIREFRYNGVKLPDPNQTFTLPQVRDFYASVYPEIISADIEGPEQIGALAVYTFRRAVGTKGATLAQQRALQCLRAGGRLAPGERPVHVLSAEQVRQPLAQRLRQILDRDGSAAGQRCLAPSANHSVLP